MCVVLKRSYDIKVPVVASTPLEIEVKGMVKHATAQKLPLRDLLTQIENKCRELTEHLKMDLGANVAELHKLTRPKRKSSPYPSIRAVCTKHERLLQAHKYAMDLREQIDEYVREIEQRIADRQF